MQRKRVLSYALGHVLNDMCASTWFSYLLLYLQKVVKLSSVESAVVMFSGQFADGIATPLVGVFSDRTEGFPSIGFGKRKTWLTSGAIMVILCYMMVFGVSIPNLISAHPSEVSTVVYYSISAALFNIGWAAVQVSHMALVPELTNCGHTRIVLNSARYAFTILSNVLVYLCFLALLQYVQPIEVPDAKKFSILCVIILCVGGFSTVGFLIGTKERVSSPVNRSQVKLADPALSDLSNRGPVGSSLTAKIPLLSEESRTTYETIPVDDEYSIDNHMKWNDWFRKRMFYVIGNIYMCTRLVINLTQVYLPFFLVKAMHMSAKSIAIVPMLVYLAGFITTFYVGKMNVFMGKRYTYCLGSVIVTISLTIAYFLPCPDAIWIYPLSVLLGFGNSLIMVISVCLEGDVIGTNVESGAFVYGAFSFTDKLSNGIAIFFIEKVKQSLENDDLLDEAAEAQFFRNVFSIIPSIAALVGMVTILAFTPKSFGHCGELERRSSV